VLRSASGTIKTLENPDGVPLGLAPDSEYLEKDAPFKPGDTIVLYTDGVSEARNTTKEEYGIERLQSAFKKSQKTATGFGQGIIKDIERFMDGAMQHDDLTILVAKMKVEKRKQTRSK